MGSIVGSTLIELAELRKSFLHIYMNILCANSLMNPILRDKLFLSINVVIMQWASNVLKKPVVTIDWLYQFHNEHRVVPLESYRVLSFSGSTICVTGIPAELTRQCTHLIAEIYFSSSRLRSTPEGDKYTVAKRWGHIYIVNRKWFDQSASRKADISVTKIPCCCQLMLNEESYPVQGSSMSSVKTASCQQNQDRVIRSSQSLPSLTVGDRDFHSISATEHADPDLETPLSQNVSSKFVDPISLQKRTIVKWQLCSHDGRVAEVSQNEDDDLYLSECRLTSSNARFPQ
ncbi:hypothetical protein EUGRSUZ_B02095 [Eucalyptus grandis]|uniref:BRCT domain-containing protein n=2 Tax=Eucalyptus grandis TaxID=71139 RepID=A0A059D3S7_EUCGR|nr:hypothetical protein EUGRSUZ_B02095 [Eucalyptus grandis]